MPTSKFQLRCLGFTVTTPTIDDMFEGDGPGDEVFFRFILKMRDKDGNNTWPVDNDITTDVIGNTDADTGRIQGGHRTPHGGFAASDWFPTRDPWSVVGGGYHPGRNAPPMIVWQGELTQGEQLLYVIPMICEWDPGPSIVEQIVNWHKQVDDKYGQKAKEIIGNQFPPYKWVFDAVSLGIQTAANAFRQGGLLGQRGSRPIGLGKVGDDYTFNPIIMTLTYDTAHNAVRSQIGGGPPGGIGITWQDDQSIGGAVYTAHFLLSCLDPLPPDDPSRQPAL